MELQKMDENKNISGEQVNERFSCEKTYELILQNQPSPHFRQ